MDALQEQNIPSSNKTAETELESERNPEPFATQLNCFNFVGFNRKGSTMYPNIFRLLHVLPALLLAFSSYGFYNFIAANYEDVLAVADCLGPLSSNIIIFTKLATFVVFEKKFYVLMDEIKALPVSDYLIFNRTLQVEKAATLTYLTSVCFTGFSLCVVPPLVDVASWWLHGTELRREMLYKASFPYATDVSPGYELTYLMETALTYFAIILLASFDSLFGGLCINICAQFEMLRESFDGDKNKFIEKHQKLLELAATLNQLSKYVVIAQFLISSTLLCVLGFQIVMQKIFIKRIAAISFGMSVILQFFVYCYGGQILKDKSSEAADRIYDIDKDFVVVIARAQRAARIKAGFFEADLPTFSAVMNSAASLITLLQSFTE